MPASEEILSSPSVRSHPVRRALLAALVVALVGWGAVARLTGDEAPESPSVAPSPPARSSASSASTAAARPVVIPPPPWVRYPTPLEGTWVGTGPPGRVTLVISNSRLTLSTGRQPPADRLLGFRTFTLAGHRLHIRRSTDPGESATYRWRITRGSLTFQLVETTPQAALRLGSAVFHRV